MKAHLKSWNSHSIENISRIYIHMKFLRRFFALQCFYFITTRYPILLLVSCHWGIKKFVNHGLSPSLTQIQWKGGTEGMLVFSTYDWSVFIDAKFLLFEIKYTSNTDGEHQCCLILRPIKNQFYRRPSD